jgi:superfamily II DNA or RNA helicase
MNNVISLKPDGWIVQVNEPADLREFIKKKLFFMDITFTGSWPTSLMQKHNRFKVGLVDYLNPLLTESTLPYQLQIDIPKLRYDESTIEHLGLVDFQKEAIVNIFDTGRGIIMSPTSSGKSNMEIALITFLPKPCVFIVPNNILLHQLTAKFKKQGFNVGTYGDNLKDLTKDVTVMSSMSLVRQSGGIKKYMKSVKSIVMDEVHHGSKGCYSVLGRCKAQHRVGFSATPWVKKTPELTKARLIANFGNVVYDGSKDERAQQFRINPKVYVANRFKKDTFDIDDVMRSIVNRDHINQKKLVISTNRDRNSYILDLAELCRCKGKNIFITTAWRMQVCALEELAEEKGMEHIYFLTGSSGPEERDLVYSKLDNKQGEKTIICGTVGGEGVDLHGLDFIIMADIGQSEIKVIQGIGRVARKAEGKQIPAVIDVKDPLYSHHFKTRSEIYEQEKFEVLTLKDLLAELSRL